MRLWRCVAVESLARLLRLARAHTQESRRAGIHQVFEQIGAALESRAYCMKMAQQGEYHTSILARSFECCVDDGRCRGVVERGHDTRQCCWSLLR